MRVVGLADSLTFKKPSRAGQVGKWVCTVLCVSLGIAIAYSAKRALSWSSHDLRYEGGLCLGAVYWAWPAEGWICPASQPSPHTGWSVAEYGGSYGMRWLVRVENGKRWRGIYVPLWMPLAVMLPVTALLWYRQRHTTVWRLRRAIRWWTPDSPRRLTIGLVALFTVLHVLAVVAVESAFSKMYNFFTQTNAPLGTFTSVIPTDLLRDAMELAFVILIWTGILWGWLWAWLFVRFRNRLFSSQDVPCCQVCGYNLTGNTSGCCPECGSKMGEQSLSPHL